MVSCATRLTLCSHRSLPRRIIRQYIPMQLFPDLQETSIKPIRLRPKHKASFSSLRGREAAEAIPSPHLSHTTNTNTKTATSTASKKSNPRISCQMMMFTVISVENINVFIVLFMLYVLTYVYILGKKFYIIPSCSRTRRYA